MKWDKRMDINPEDETSYNVQCQLAFLKYVEYEYCIKHRRLLVTKPESIPNYNLFFSRMASRSGQSSYDHYDLSSNDDEYLMHNHLGEMTPGRSDPAARHNWNSPQELPQH
jgi:hypothetical protein